MQTEHPVYDINICLQFLSAKKCCEYASSTEDSIQYYIYELCYGN